ncbi:DUF2975 domain-containing protein [Aeromicrobium sp. SMF47]|uniref:DUF2975 domain-containing protein n=1 Tax=Aeromicrobium yanjiei TaxID=2662028 RepID=A0A5Q2MQD2_9ACTN|nr:MULTISPECIES: DUF2975 domain-containing protein [Aeromicrobium]MRJ76341.1 DUF2975 domain-containing protein [Aeromicrobium yanjiei]MRK00692.1 DUF2975 domain-containing protein [Aeromicrobium sp. S22]QGG42480.1 DUF2975 domain-containing protein [Aeromicrobium yanjiei]
MARPTILVLRLVIAAIVLGSLFVQVVIVPLLATDLSEDVNDDVAAVRVPVVVIILLAIVCVQVSMISVWRLLTMVRRGTVFSPRAFRHVDVVIGAIAVAAALMFALGAVLAPGEAAAPGVVLLIGGLGVLLAGVALIVTVQRALLVQAVERDVRAQQLESELGEVI